MNNINNKKVNKRNWKEINYKSITQIEVLFDISFLNTEKQRLNEQNKNKKGRRFKYSDELIKFALILMYYFRFDYRRTQALLTFMKKFMPKLPVPDYTRLCVRQKILSVFLKNIKKHKNKILRIALDGSGLSVINKGDYLRVIHKDGKISKKTGFVKFVIAVDIDTLEITGLEVSDDKNGENKKVKSLLEQTIKNKDQPIDVLFADGTYHPYENFEMLEDMGIKQVINIPKNAITEIKMNKNKYISRRRNIKRKIPIRTIKAKEQLEDKQKWKKDNEYGLRWIVEIVFSNFKRNFGHYINCKNKNSIQNEILLKSSLYNRLVNM